MRRPELLLIILFIASCAQAQVTVVRYSNSRSFEKDVPKERAKFSRTIVTADDGRVTLWDTDLKKDEIVRREAHNGDEPFGVWIYQRSSGTAELDYEFEMKYAEPACVNEGVLAGFDDYFVDHRDVAYKAPVLANGKTIGEFLGSSLFYPVNARRRGIEGVVRLSFRITKEGNTEQVVVNRGTHLLLDKEAMRVFRALKFSAPPMVNGEPADVCIEMPLTFKLG
jgi:TonB family protein